MLEPKLPTKTRAECRPTRARISGLPLEAQSTRRRVNTSCVLTAEVTARIAWSGTSFGAFQMARMASPMNSSMVPCSSMMMDTMLSKYSLSSLRTSTGGVRSQIVVQPAMSEKKMLTLRSVTPSCATAPSRRKCRTTSSGVNFENERTATFRLWNAAWRLRTSNTVDVTTSSGGVTLFSSSFAVCDMSFISCRIGTTSWFAMPSASEEKISEKPSKDTMITVVKPIENSASSMDSRRMS
mmetsp:Transcript_61044/g.176826  ORF Transcript_61044/g.176826 Transcript_61044/m.176826 type:complete len:239 (+) Transcript_61044:444-1160(+)